MGSLKGLVGNFPTTLYVKRCPAGKKKSTDDLFPTNHNSIAVQLWSKRGNFADIAESG